MPLRSIPDRALVAALLLLNAALKLSWLGVNELSLDEPFTVYWSQRPLGELWAMLRTENNPPLYFMLMKAWSAATPFEAAWLRVPAAVFSALTVWPLFLLANRLGGRTAAFTAALIFTFSNYHFGFAHEVRAYALFTLLTTTGLWLLLRGKDLPDNGLRAMLGLSALNVVLLYTHFFGWLSIGLQFLCVLLLPELRHLRRNYLIGLGITCAWYLPYAAIFLSRLGASVSRGTWLDAPVPEELYNMVWRWSNAPVLAVSFLFVIGLACWRTKAKPLGLRLGLLWTFVPLFGMFAVSYAVPVFLDRYLAFAAPGFAMLVSLSLAAVNRYTRASIGLSAVAALGMLATFTPWKDNGRHASQVVKQVDAWCGGTCTTQVLPRWFWLNYQAGDDLGALQNDLTPLLNGEPVANHENGVPLPWPTDSSSCAIVVDAGAHLVDPGRSWYRELKKVLPAVDSVEADHRVWVYRFRRSDE